MIVSLLFHALLFFPRSKLFIIVVRESFFFSFYIVGVENETHKKKGEFREFPFDVEGRME